MRKIKKNDINEKNQRKVARKERVIKNALYTIEKKATVRRTAKEYNISKSTVYRDLTVLLPEISMPLYHKVCEVLKWNKQQRYRRGGIAAQKKKK